MNEETTMQATEATTPETCEAPVEVEKKEAKPKPKPKAKGNGKSTVGKVVGETLERINVGINEAIDEAKKALLVEATSEGVKRLDRLVTYGAELREELSRRLGHTSKEVKDDAGKVKAETETACRKACDNANATAERYKKHLDAMAKQIEAFGRRMDSGLAEVPALRDEVRALRTELAGLKVSVDSAIAETKSAKELVINAKASMLGVSNGLSSLRRFVDIIADKTGVRRPLAAD